jgi:hypothetical protein
MSIPAISTLAPEVERLLGSLGAAGRALSGGTLPVSSPISGEIVAHLHPPSAAEARRAIDTAHAAFLAWRNVPAPQRGELVRLLGEELRAHKEPLGRLVTIEAGKILSEGLGEVQEMIDICNFAVGLSRQLHGVTDTPEQALALIKPSDPRRMEIVQSGFEKKDLLAAAYEDKQPCFPLGRGGRNCRPLTRCQNAFQSRTSGQDQRCACIRRTMRRCRPARGRSDFRSSSASCMVRTMRSSRVMP